MWWTRSRYVEGKGDIHGYLLVKIWRDSQIRAVISR